MTGHAAPNYERRPQIVPTGTDLLNRVLDLGRGGGCVLASVHLIAARAMKASMSLVRPLISEADNDPGPHPHHQ